MAFDPDPIGFVDRQPWSLRESGAPFYTQQAEKMRSLTPEQLRKNRAGMLRKHLPQASSEVKAAIDAWEAQQPYLSPKLTLEKAMTVDSLLGERYKSAFPESVVRYGNLTVGAEDAEYFETLQRELAAIDPRRAARQLHQLMHGGYSTSIVFSDAAGSMNLRCALGNIIIINRRLTVQDPYSGAITSLALVMGHEIEHANIPSEIQMTLGSIADRLFTHAEEIRVIDGYENGMHKANGSSERSTHAAHSVPIDPMDGKSIAFPYTVVGESEKIQYLRPGSHLSGIMIDANDEYITLKVDGRKIRIATSTLLKTAGPSAGAFHRFGFTHHQLSDNDRRAASEGIQKILHEAGALRHPTLANFRKIPLIIERKMMNLPEPREQIRKWEEAAKRGDVMTLTVNKAGLINLSRISKDPDPITTMRRRSAEINRPAMMRRAIALALTASVIGLGIGVVVLIAYFIKQHKKQTRKPMFLLQPPPDPLLTPQNQNVLIASLRATL